MGIGWSAARKSPEKDYARDENRHADEMRRRGPAAQVMNGVVAAEKFNERSQDGVADQVSSEDLPVETFSAIKPFQNTPKDETEQRVIYLCGMDWHASSGVFCWKTNRPGQIARPAITTAVHETADPAKDVAE